LIDWLIEVVISAILVTWVSLWFSLQVQCYIHHLYQSLLFFRVQL